MTVPQAILHIGEPPFSKSSIHHPPISIAESVGLCNSRNWLENLPISPSPFQSIPPYSSLFGDTYISLIMTESPTPCAEVVIIGDDTTRIIKAVTTSDPARMICRWNDMTSTQLYRSIEGEVRNSTISAQLHVWH